VTDFDRSLAMHSLFEKQAERAPQRVALRFGDQLLSYGDLEARSNRLARVLRARGTQRGSLVGLCVERSPEMVVSMLAVLKAGGAYLPLDPEFPVSRLAFMVEDSKLTLVISESHLAERHGCAPEHTLELDRCGAEIAKQPSERLAADEAAAEGKDAAYVLYTSGSTGKPKGVCIPHRAAVNFLLSMQHEPGLGETDRLVAVTTLSFDIALLELMLPLTVGAQVILSSSEEVMDGAALRRLLESNEATVMQATPVTWRMLIDSGWQGHERFKALCGGEALAVDLAEALLQRTSELWNMYGPTETTVWSTCWRVERPRQGIYIGRPIANTTVHILDKSLRRCPVGVPGEIYIGGDGLALGYLNRPALTAERFVAAPFAAGHRLYKTGDLGRWREGGILECLGRTDFQVKVRGHRIELGEIETALTSHDSVKQAAVIVREDRPGDARLVAYVIPAQSTIDESALRTHLRAALPEYMVPRHFVALGSFPTTPNGKIDRKALPAPAAAANQPSTSDARMPRSESERKIAAILCEALELRSVGLDEDFFDLGGHSLLAVRIVSRINQEFGTSLPVRVLFEARTCAQLAQKVAPRTNRQLRAESDGWPIVIPIQPSGSGTPLFCVSRPNVNALGYALLARHLGPEQPVYGLQAQLPEDPAIDFTKQQYEDTAREYIKAMRSVQPQGPYHVIGQCQGAYIAFEMARQIEATNQPFGWLGILDAWTEENTRRKWLFAVYRYAMALRSRALRIVNKIKRARPRANPRGLIVPAASTALAANPGAARPPGPSPKPTPGLLLRTYFPGKDFRPPAISSRITVFTVGRPAFYRVRDKRMGWGDRTRGGVEVERVPGEHMTLLREPHVIVLAEKLRRWLPPGPTGGASGS